MATDFYSAVKSRRSIYALNKDITTTDERILEAVLFAVKHTPSAFNSQSARVVVLLKQHHQQLWDITERTLQKLVPEESFAATQEKMNAFRSGYGTILFFEDWNVITGLQKQFALYKENFPVWAQQSNGMLQYVIWTALEQEGLGASLQHYNPLIDEEVKQTWSIPNSWKLIAQMPFGNPSAPAGDKEFQPLEQRVMVFR
jgi:predicted oxidoreductase (fatty acid repression mutant protein)